jgi:hypothetical protein
MIFPKRFSFDSILEEEENKPLTDEEFYKLFGRSRIKTEENKMYSILEPNRRMYGTLSYFSQQLDQFLAAVDTTVEAHNTLKHVLPPHILPKKNECEKSDYDDTFTYIMHVRKKIIRESIVDRFMDRLMAPSVCDNMDASPNDYIKEFFMVEYNLSSTANPSWMCGGSFKGYINLGIPKEKNYEGLFVRISSVLFEQPLFELAHYHTESFGKEARTLEEHIKAFSL